MRARAIAIIAGLAPLATGCAATFGTAGSVRVSRSQSEVAPTAEELRLAPVATMHAGPHASPLSLEFAPELTLGRGTAAAVRARVRASARWSDAGPAHPVLTASVEDGETRPAELAGDTIAPGPTAAIVHSRMLRAAAAVRFDRGRRLRFAGRLEGERSDGVGASARTLPTLAAWRAQATARYDASRRTTIEAGAQLGDERTGDAAALATGRLSATVSTHLSPSSVVFTRAGFVGVVGGGAPDRLPTLEVGGSVGDASSATHLAASVARGPEVDRLDGSLRNRLRTRVRLETRLVPLVSFGGTLQRASDLDGFAQRAVSNGDVGFSIALARGQRLDVGVARFVQSTGGHTTNAETRAVVQFTLAPIR